MYTCITIISVHKWNNPYNVRTAIKYMYMYNGHAIIIMPLLNVMLPWSVKKVSYEDGCNFSFAIRRISAAFFLSSSASCLSLRAISSSLCTSCLMSSTSFFTICASLRISLACCRVLGMVSREEVLAIPTHNAAVSSSESGLSTWVFFFSVLLCLTTLVYYR